MKIYLNGSQLSGCNRQGSIYIKTPTTDINDEFLFEKTEVKYFDMSGNETTPKEGLYIKEENGKRTKIFIQKF